MINNKGITPWTMFRPILGKKKKEDKKVTNWRFVSANKGIH
jgi:hypothetical protein